MRIRVGSYMNITEIPLPKKKIKVDIVSDVVCPWCYIGKRRLEKAIEQVSDQYDFELNYYPFELNPEMPKNGRNQRDYLSDKFGGEERYEQITNHTTSIAATEGLTFDFSKQQISPNTRDLHVVLQLARHEGKQLLVMEAFFKAYFTDGVDLSSRENITAVAVAAGLSQDDVKKALDDEQARLTVAASEKEMYNLGISGVPFYIINNTYGISGAQMSETFVKAFQDVGKKMVVAGGEACDVDGKNC